MTKDQKAYIAKKARTAGLSMGEFLRQAAESYRPDQNARVLDSLATQVLKTSERAMRTIDETLAFVGASEKRLAKLRSRTRKDAQRDSARGCGRNSKLPWILPWPHNT